MKQLNQAGAAVKLRTKLMQGAALHQRGALAEAAAVYREVLAAAPRDFDALHLLGVLEGQRGNPAGAAELLGRAVRVNPRDATAHMNHGNALLELKRVDDALASYDRSVRLNPGDAQALYNRGVALAELCRPRDALESYQQALARQPGHADAAYGTANMLCALGRPAEAVAAYDRTLALDPKRADVWVNRGNALQEMGKTSAALESYARALAVAPEHVDAHLNEALCRLLTGDYENGWRLYEWRWRTPAGAAFQRRFAQAQWNGVDAVAGKTMLLHAEQGLGDTIQFCRYAKLVADRGAKVVVEVQPPLVALLSTLRAADQVLAHGDAVPPFDLHCPLVSLPGALHTRVDSIPADVPYLCSDPVRVMRWRTTLGETGRPRVGLVWSGSGTLENDRRSIALADFAQLCTGTLAYFGLQKEVRSTDHAALQECTSSRNLGPELGDFADTAALIELMDIVVTVDTSVAHLAGAMGKPVWILLSSSPTWRWLLDRNDSPWYPSARLFRQSTPGDWSAPLQEVKRALQALA
ncbi:MAG: tetratricopeptide repeat protein [Alphaproteobacteria bacterium]|nr:tetratricopeptide repeat protein [Alphaproteobacteria bacterium]